ncbi:ABC transporter substrate-binding protein [Desulfovulcanus sp.]
MSLRYKFIYLFVCLVFIISCTSEQELGYKRDVIEGVTDNEIVLGSSLALKGHAGYLGTQTLRGAKCYINYINDNGGVYGRKIKIIAYDDSYDPPKCLANTQRLLIDDQVFALFCYVGTPTTVKVLPMIEEAKIPLIGMFTGANALREPFNPYLINIRPSYYQETREAVRHLVQDLKLQRIAVFYQYDAYGFDGLTGTELALKDFGLAPVARGSYIRGTLDIDEAFNKIRLSRAQAVVMIGTYDPCAGFIQLAQEKDYHPVFYNLSFVGAEELARKLKGTKEIVLMSQVVPPPISFEGVDNEDLPNYVNLLKRYYPGDTPNYVGFEGYINAKVLVEGLRRAGRDLTRSKLIKAIESIKNFSLEGDINVHFGTQDHQGMDKIYFTRLQKDEFVLIEDWEEIKYAREIQKAVPEK